MTTAVGDLIEVTNVRKSFGNFHVLRDLTLTFPNDCITTILGPSGTGKSVLLNHIVGLLEPDAGEIKVFGTDIWKINEDERNEMRKRFGVLFQDGALFGSINLFENVAYPLEKNTSKSPEEIHEIVTARLEEVGLAESAYKFPGEISGGMRKRAGFARALATEPEIVMFDEPDSGLDPVRTSLLCDLILEAHQRHRGTYVVVTHDIGVVRKVSDYVGVLWKGRLIFYGSAEEAFNSDDPFVRQFLAGESRGPLGMD
jgi:phospholipid/cholesterol/gamma-HCH transport system ATP-binding protein